MKNRNLQFFGVTLTIVLLAFSLSYALPLSAATGMTEGSNIGNKGENNNVTITGKKNASPVSFDTTSTTTSVSTTSTGNWWDSLGTPKYGGTLYEKLTQNVTTWDPYTSTNGQAGYAPYLESMWINNYATDPSVWDFSIGWLPDQYAAGNLVNSYSMPNPYTVICHLPNNIYWQNIPPANGRQFTSTDVVNHYDRLLGLGNGFTKDPYYVSVTGWNPLLSVVATDKFTVVFNWTNGAVGPTSILSIMEAAGADNSIEDPEAVQANTTPSQPILTNWQNAVGTGPFILTNFIGSSSATFVKNPNYWGHDLRWPQNQLPYVGELKVLIIPNTATAEAAFSTGKLDSFSAMPTQDALNMMRTNPSIIVKQKPQGSEFTLDPRNDLAPYNNEQVREAMQHAIDIPTIATFYYQGYATPWPASLTQNQMGIGGWGDPYTQWPADVQAQYSYNPTLAKQMLAVAGYPNGFSTDLVLETDADMNLYQIVQSYLAAIGINMSITLMDPASWQAYVMTAHKEDALAARNQGILGFNFDIFRQFMRFTPGYQSNYILVNDPNMTNFNSEAIAAQSISAVQTLLQQANLYVAQQHFAISLAQPSIFDMVQPWVGGNPGTNSLGDAVTGAGFGDGVPLAVWIDQNLKSSDGYFDAPQVINSTGASNVAATTATLNGTVTSTGGQNPTVYFYWGTTDGIANPANWSNNTIIGSEPVGAFSSSITGLTPNTIYYYRCYANNSGGDSWSGVETFTTLPIPVAPTVTNSTGASAITDTTATLNGNLTNNGNQNPTVQIYWGTSDGGTTAGNWANNINLGTQPAGAFSSNITGLTASTTYYYRCYASNSGGNSWAATTASFTTAAITVTVNAPAKVAANNYQFNVPINISQVSNFYGCQFDVLFDSTVLQYVSTTWGQIGATSMSGNGTASSNNIAAGDQRFLVSLSGLSSGISGSGTIATIRFQVIGNIGQSSTINLSNGILSDFTAQSIPATWINGSVQVSVIPGDANGDGVVNVLDMTKCAREILGLDALTPGADANGDGNVNVLDMTKIARIILGLDP